MSREQRAPVGRSDEEPNPRVDAALWVRSGWPWEAWESQQEAVSNLRAQRACWGPEFSACSCVTIWVVVKPEVLQKATVELLDQSLCASLYGPSLTDRMVCAGYLDGKVDSCQVGCQAFCYPLSPRSQEPSRSS